LLLEDPDESRLADLPLVELVVLLLVELDFLLLEDRDEPTSAVPD